MALPEGLSLEHHRDLAGRTRTPLVRNVLLALLCAVLLLALLNVFGQVPRTDTAETSVARLEVDAPKAIRGGLYFQARYRVEAIEEIEDATVVLDPGWLEDITLNTVEPAPVGEASRDGRIALQLGRIPAGDEHIVLERGEPVMKNLARNRVTVGELRAAVRHEGYASLDEIEWAVLETSGRFSFIGKRS
jgi:hypothetical protein